MTSCLSLHVYLDVHVYLVIILVYLVETFDHLYYSLAIYDFMSIKIVIILVYLVEIASFILLIAIYTNVYHFMSILMSMSISDYTVYLVETFASFILLISNL